MMFREKVQEGLWPKFPYTVIDPKRDVELSIGIKDRVLYITFLGSVSWKDWLHNFMFWKKPYRNMKRPFFVHAGFLKIYKIIRDHIHVIMDIRAEDFDTVKIRGHSLGGAIATLCHEDLTYLREMSLMPDSTGKMFDKQIETVVSGCPRVFGVLFRGIPAARCSDIIRIEYKNDHIPHLPPAVLGYRHVGTQVRIGRPKWLGWLHPSAVYDHSWKAYGALDEQREESPSNNELYSGVVDVYSMLAILVLVLPFVILLFIGGRG